MNILISGLPETFTEYFAKTMIGGVEEKSEIKDKLLDTTFPTLSEAMEHIPNGGIEATADEVIESVFLITSDN